MKAKRISTVQERLAAATQAGADLYHPVVTLDELRRSIERNPCLGFTTLQAEAWLTLTPGAWWSAFNRGWATAAADHGQRTVIDGY